jgi:hypothetical protein
VKFIVNVKLVEKRVNRAVGKVMVEKVTSQYKRPGMTLATRISMLPSEASHVADVLPSGTLLSTDGEFKAAIILAALAVAEGKLQEGMKRRSVIVVMACYWR